MEGRDSEQAWLITWLMPGATSRSFLGQSAAVVVRIWELGWALHGFGISQGAQIKPAPTEHPVPRAMLSLHGYPLKWKELRQVKSLRLGHTAEEEPR